MVRCLQQWRYTPWRRWPRRGSDAVAAAAATRPRRSAPPSKLALHVPHLNIFGSFYTFQTFRRFHTFSTVFDNFRMISNVFERWIWVQKSTKVVQCIETLGYCFSGLNAWRQLDCRWLLSLLLTAPKSLVWLSAETAITFALLGCLLSPEIECSPVNIYRQSLLLL